MIDYTQLEIELKHTSSFSDLIKPEVIRDIVSIVKNLEQKDIEIQVKHPTHYNLHPSGVECIEVASQYDYCLGSAIKYRWRRGLKDGQPVEKEDGKAKQFLEFRKQYFSNEELVIDDVDTLINNHINFILKQRKENDNT